VVNVSLILGSPSSLSTKKNKIISSANANIIFYVLSYSNDGCFLLVEYLSGCQGFAQSGEVLRASRCGADEVIFANFKCTCANKIVEVEHRH
jgi:hypothetical protein